jgi:hypothetical protein
MFSLQLTAQSYRLYIVTRANSSKGFACSEKAQLAHYFSQFSTGMLGALRYYKTSFAELCRRERLGEDSVDDATWNQQEKATCRGWNCFSPLLTRNFDPLMSGGVCK